MTIYIGDKPEMNVVNVGDELTQSQIDAIAAAAAPSTGNPFATIADVGGGGGVLDDYEQTVTWEQYGASSPDLSYGKFIDKLTDDGMMGHTNLTAFQNAGQPYAIQGCGKAIVTYVISVEIISFGHTHSSPSGQTRYFGTGYNDPYNQFNPVGMTSYIYEGYMSNNVPTYGPIMSGTKSVTFNHTEIVGTDVGYVFPQLSCSENMSQSADWRITVYLKVQKGLA